MTAKTAPKDSKRIGIRKDLKKYTYLGCPITKNQTPWCFRTCRPNADGTGFCGRLAPHSFKGRIQQGIEDFKKAKAESSTLLRYQGPSGDKDA